MTEVRPQRVDKTSEELLAQAREILAEATDVQVRQHVIDLTRAIKEAKAQGDEAGAKHLEKVRQLAAAEVSARSPGLARRRTNYTE